jgi:hypothetical protein
LAKITSEIALLRALSQKRHWLTADLLTIKRHVIRRMTMSLTEMSPTQLFFSSPWGEELANDTETRTAHARRAALIRRARAYVDQYLAKATPELTGDNSTNFEDNADDIAFGRSDCDFLFRD